ncbi:unnamed protein product [Diatraea saccharalis]|uniref:Mitochondrial ATP synthase regulatory component factor B n=1 Tax=Diatraea saccharalis TaxID=40085 RepID=A0A9N9R154_9NEOP|nr:unnamed protein product [Diatraea saccharalis]
MMFNKPDPQRLLQVGPDRACAEWVLRNGGKVVWANGQSLADYNNLPPEDEIQQKLIEIDGTDSSISHYGFPHLSNILNILFFISCFSINFKNTTFLEGCSKLERVILHNSKYIDDRAMKGLSYGKETLLHVQVSRCPNITDDGLKELTVLSKLQKLILFDLQSVSDLHKCKEYLKSQLPQCSVKGNVK